VAVGRARLDRSVKDPDETAQLVHAPVMGTILRDDAVARWHTMDRASDTRTGEGFRQLRLNLQFLNVDDPPKVIMVTSAVPAEGKTTLVINLAMALSFAGHRVTIIEADLRRPKVTTYLGLVGGVGLTNVLSGSASLDEVVQQYREDLFVLPAGPQPPNPGELLASSHMAALVDKLRGENDFVLLDVPPVLPVADAAGLAAVVDGALLSVRYGRTRKDQVKQASLTLRGVGTKLLGVVLNVVPANAAVASLHAYGYGYDVQHPSDSAEPRGRSPRRRRRGTES
jgi:capsular exopolysaccharide synthesis family protein